MWNFDEGNGTTAQDSSSNDNDIENFRCTGQTAWTRDSKYGDYALEFDGENGCTGVSAYYEFNSGSPDEMTAEAWIKLDKIDRWNPVYAHYEDGYFRFYVDDDNKLNLRVYSSSDGWYTVTGTTELESDVWYHVAATYSSTTDRIRVYLDGYVDGNTTIPSAYTMHNRDCCDNWVGYDNFWEENFDGIIDEVRISNIERTAFATPDTITFNGSATDQSGYVAAYSWTSSIDNLLNTQANFTIHESNLSFGNHTITFRAQDETGAWSVSRTTNITVRSYPYARITSVEPWYVNIGTQVNFTATAIAPDSNLTDYLWWSSIDGNLSTNLSFNSTSLSYGNHTILFKAKNERGEWSQPYFADDGVSFVLVNDIPVASITDISPDPATKG